jgi:DME family drug/metabolite transporter
LITPIVLLLPVVVWGLTPIFYRSYLEKMSATRVNLLRTFSASIFLLIPFLAFGMDPGLGYGAISGLLTLALGDTLFFVSIRLVGASIATPLLYVQTVLIQFIAPSIGEPVSGVHLLSAGLIIFSVYLLSRGQRSQIRLRGVGIGLIAAIIESVGQSSIKLATSGGANPFSIAFSRTGAASLGLGCILLATRGRRKRQHNRKNDTLTWRGYVALAALSVLDIGIGSAAYIFSVGSVGIVTSTIILGLSPLITQLGAKLSKKESPSLSDSVAGALIVLAIGITVL